MALKTNSFMTEIPIKVKVTYSYQTKTLMSEACSEPR